MNASEINGSNWELWYFFAAAIPLAVITVLIPLTILPIINFFVRHYRVSRSVWEWTCIFITFILFVTRDALYYSLDLDKITPTLSSIATGPSPVICVLFAYDSLKQQLSRIRHLKRARQHSPGTDDGQVKKLTRKLVLQTLVWLAVVVCLCIGEFQPGVDLTPYVAYFIYKGW